MNYKTEVLNLPSQFNVIPLIRGTKGQSYVKWSQFQNHRVPEELFEAWFAQYGKDCNWAVLTGKLSGIVVVDIDSQKGVEFFNAKGIDILNLPTPIVRTGSGRGYHIYFQYPVGVEVRNSASLIADTVDIRGEGGLVVAAGSLHPETNKPYVWLEGHSPDEVEIAPCAGWLIEMIKNAKQDNGAKSEKSSEKSSGKDSMPKELKNIIQNGVSEGNRNDAASRVAGYYISKGLDVDEVMLVLNAWNSKNHPPLSDDELRKVIDSIYDRDENNLFSMEGKPRQDKIASVLLNKFRMKFLPTEGNQLYIYREGYYQPDTQDFRWLKKEILNLVGDKYYTTQLANKVIELVIMNDRVIVRPEECIRDKDYINVNNGLIHIKTGNLELHTPDIFTTTRIPVNYDPKADCPKFLMYLNSTLDGEYHPIMQEFMGYCLAPTTEYQKSLILYGTGANGKSVFIDVISRLIGAENTVSMDINTLCTNRFAVVRLKDKLLNACSENPVKIAEENERLKSIITGDNVMVEDKGLPLYTMRPFAKHIFAVNQLPRMSDWSRGNYRRWIIVKFEKNFESSPNRSLTNELYEEISGIFNFALVGLQRLFGQNGFTNSEKVSNNLREMEINSDSVLAFVDEQCEINQATEIKSSTLYELYKKYCVDDGRKYAVSSKAFTIRLRERFNVIVEHRRDGNYLRNITLKYID